MVRKQSFFDGIDRNCLDDAIDEMISTQIDAHLLYEIKRFHSDNDVSWLGD